MTVISFPGRRGAGRRPLWAVRVWLEDRAGHRSEDAAAVFATADDASAWALAQLECRRATHADRLGGPDGACYAAAVTGPGGRCNAYLFSDWEPVEWDCAHGASGLGH